MWSTIVYWVIVAALMMPPAQAGTNVGDYRGLPADLAAAATAYDLAQFKADRAELNRLLADDYVIADAAGKIRTKTESITSATAPGSKTLSVEISQQIRRTWTDGAVLGGVVDAKSLDHGRATTMRAHFIDVWVRRKGRWQVVFTQMDKTQIAQGVRDVDRSPRQSRLASASHA